MKANPVKDKLKSGGIVIGSEVSRFRCSDIPRVYAAAGFDFVFIDMEHSGFHLETVGDLIRTARQADIVPVVRVPQAEYAWISRVLDCGAQGIIVPRVNTPEQVEQIVSWTRYPPQGIRGFACNTAQTDGQPVGIDEFIDASNQSMLVVIQIERREAVANLSEMLSIDGVDVACLGLMDLTIDLGVPGRIDHPLARDAVQQLLTVAEEQQVAAGVISASQETIAQYVTEGVRFVSYATDEILLQRASEQAVQQLKATCRELPAL